MTRVRQMVADTYAAMFWLMAIGDLEPEHITVERARVANPALSSGPYVNVVARRDGREIVFTVAPIDAEVDAEFEREWKTFVLQQPSMTRLERDQVVAESRWANYALETRGALLAKGFRLRGAS